MKIHLLGWECSGLRCPDMKVDLGSDGKVPKVSLVQMPNGTGKTTVLTLLRAALTGEARQWKPETIAEFCSRDNSIGTGKCIVRLSVDGEPLTFELQLSFAEGEAHYRTTSPSAGGVVQDWHPPRDVRRFLTEKFVGLFVFDGELASRLLNPSMARAEEAIDALCQLDLLDEVGIIAENAWTKVTKDMGAKTSQGLAMWRRREEILSRQIRTVRQAEKKAAEELEKKRRELEEIDSKVSGQIAADKVLQAELERMKLAEKEQMGNLESSLSTVIQGIRQPHRLHPMLANALGVLKKRLDKAKLPDVTSRQFFIELAEEPKCVCGRPIGEKERESILSEAGRYLGEDISGVINALKQDIETQVLQTDPEQSTLPAELHRLAENEQKLHRTQTELQGLEAKGMESAGEDIKALKERREKLQAEQQQLTEALEEMQRAARSGEDESTCCLASLERQRAEARKKIAEITNTVELRRRTDVIRAITKNAKDRARDRLKKALVGDCNRRLGKILEADPIRVATIQSCIVLEGQKEGSAGQNLAVGYTFLATALHRGAHEFPLVVDSPAGPLDDKLRREIGEMVPQLCDQFIAFTISTERKDFLPAIEKAAGKNIRYITLFRNTKGTAHLIKGLPKQGVKNSKDGILVEGREYFVQFSLAEESEV